MNKAIWLSSRIIDYCRSAGRLINISRLHFFYYGSLPRQAVIMVMSKSKRRAIMINRRGRASMALAIRMSAISSWPACMEIAEGGAKWPSAQRTAFHFSASLTITTLRAWPHAASRCLPQGWGFSSSAPVRLQVARTLRSRHKPGTISSRHCWDHAIV